MKNVLLKKIGLTAGALSLTLLVSQGTPIKDILKEHSTALEEGLDPQSLLLRGYNGNQSDHIERWKADLIACLQAHEDCSSVTQYISLTKTGARWVFDLTTCEFKGLPPGPVSFRKEGKIAIILYGDYTSEQQSSVMTKAMASNKKAAAASKPPVGVVKKLAVSTPKTTTTTKIPNPRHMNSRHPGNKVRQTA